MKKIKILLMLVLATTNLVAQSNYAESKKEYSTYSYQLFPTQNMYTFIKLDTRNGQMWQVQWSTESKSRFETTLSKVALANKDEEMDGRFFLYPTTNIYNFILLDKIDGRTWQVQWGKEEDRGVMRIN
jgi:hypothetical protein